MLSKEAFDQAYQNGVAAALNEWGLTKTALIPELATKLMGGVRAASETGVKGGLNAANFLSQNPVLSRALIGAGVGGAVGGVSDIGAGRGMLAGGLGGAGLGLGRQWGRQAVRSGFKRDLAEAAQMHGPTQRGVAAPRFQARNAVRENYTGGRGAEGLKQTINRGGLIGGLGLGTALGGGALMATQPEQPKPWYAGLMGG